MLSHADHVTVWCHIILTCGEREAVLSIPDLFLDLLKFLQACILPLYQLRYRILHKSRLQIDIFTYHAH